MSDLYSKLRENLELLHNAEDLDFQGLVQEEISVIKREIFESDTLNSRSAIIEIRSGAGGDEAELFAGELSRMYMRYAELKGWKVSIDSRSESSIGGIKELIATISGEFAYGYLKFEAGVHRVQRVPKTEKSGRIHTSAVSVVVMPEIKSEEVLINPSDLKIDVYRSGGHGGQSVNTTDSAVRITHIPSGIVVICQDERSQLKNKDKAMKTLRARLWQKDQEEKIKELSEKRLSMIGSGDRSDKIRTYNYPQDRITDHRIGKSFSQVENVLSGKLQPIIDSLLDAEATENASSN